MTMVRPRLIRGLRIAVSAVCLIACVLLVVLWVRSYRWNDDLSLWYATSINFQSVRGDQLIAISSDPWEIYKSSKFRPDPRRPWNWTLRSHPLPNDNGERIGFIWEFRDNGILVVVPHWSLIILPGFIAATFSIPWIPWRFSLRTLLIATTLIAVVLGLVV